MAYGDLRTRGYYGITAFESGMVGPGEDDAYTELNVRTITGDASAVLGGITVRNKSQTPADENDPLPRIQVALAPDAADNRTVFVEPDSDSLSLSFDPTEVRYRLWIRGSEEAVAYEVIYEWERGPK